MARVRREGSSKDVWKIIGLSGTLSEVYFGFSDRVSIFDRGKLPIEFPGLGALRCAIAGKIFQELRNSSFATNYDSHNVTSARMWVRPFNIKELGVDYGDIARGYILPVEFICRMEVTDKLIARIETGRVPRANVERLLWGDDLKAGVALTPGFVECSTKFESVDRYLSDAEAALLLGQNMESLQRDIYVFVQEIFRFLSRMFRSVGFELKDGKVELGMSSTGKLVIVDSISPDELRLIGPDGRSHDKDPVRQWYQETFPDWYTKLLVAKAKFPADKTKWPDYPAAPPQSIIDDVVSRYRLVAEAIGAL